MVVVPVVVFAAVVAIANRSPVTFRLDPFSGFALSLPLFLLRLGVMARHCSDKFGGKTSIFELFQPKLSLLGIVPDTGELLT